MNDPVWLGLAAILFAVAIAIVVGTRILWIQQVGHVSYTYTPASRKNANKN